MSSTLRQRQVSPQAEADKASAIIAAEEIELTEGQKFIVPNFTIKQLLDAIPAHCYKRSAFKSSLYVVQDVILLGALIYGAYHIESFLGRFALSPIAFAAAQFTLWSAYIFSAGLVGTGIWVIAHEAGHQAYSPSKTINNSVGWVLHSFLLVPYHSWRISHGRHHAATGHLTRDEVFVPKTRSQLGIQPMKHESEDKGINVPAWRRAELYEALGESPIASLWGLFLHQIFGWPMYLIRNASGQKHYPRFTNHFQPSSIIFKTSQYWDIIISDLGIAIMFSLLGFWTYNRGFKEVALVYGLPYLWVNHWLVAITFLQHTDPELPHYSEKEWTFARGALATVDREGGWIEKYILHRIVSTHVAHHTSSRIPHYHGVEATNALKAFLGPHYKHSDKNVFVEFYRIFRECRFIEDGHDIAFYKNMEGVAQKVGVIEGDVVSDSGVDGKDQ